MKSISEKVVKHKKLVIIVFAITIILCAALSKLVSVNYSIVSYLPDDSLSTIALETMNKEFTSAPPNARAMLPEVSIPEAMEYKKLIWEVEGVQEIIWLDDFTNIYQPIEVIDEKILDSYYKDGNALFTIVIKDSESQQAVEDINSILGEQGELTGDIVDTVTVKRSTGSETGEMMLFIIPIILLILVLTTSSWFEPILFMIVIGVAIIINNGTNAFLGEVSFITKTTSSILLMAVSMDYSIFLLHRFSEFRAEGQDVKTAMINAMTKSFSSIVASGLTTIIGFGALIIMRFKIGPDLGIVLAKGIVFSMLSILLLLPVLTIYLNKFIEKTHHRSFLPSFDKFGKFAVKLGIPVMLLIGIVIIPAYRAQSKNDFIYGASVMGNAPSDISKTEQLFGKANNMVLLLPKGDVVKEKALYDELLSKPYISGVVSYVGTIGKVIPQAMIPEDKLTSLESDQFSRMVLTLTTEQESSAAFNAVEEIRALGEKYYGNTYFLSGGSASVLDLKDTITKDNMSVTILAIVGIGIVILFMFRSLSLPLILLITIETSIWVNLAFPYFKDEKMVYIGFMIISSIQLGATVDYAILFANRYIENRMKMHKKQAAIQTVSDTASSILTSAGILIAAGFIMGAISTNGIIGQLGTLIGRGTLLSAFLVLFFLPSMLVILDKVIQKTTLNIKFYKGEEINE